MTTRPVVAITTDAPDEDARFTQPAGYHDAVRRAGGRAMLVPPGEDDVEGLLDMVDAVVVTGGADVDPARWGEPRHPEVYGTSDLRDGFELELLVGAIERGIPTLAICRGMQVLNVALGGSLIQHLPDAVGEIVVHRADPPGPVPHLVKVEPDAVVAEAMGSAEVEIASWHHQAIDRLGDGLRVVAAASDGVVEAVELRGHAFVLAVQWHPELTADRDPTQQALFDALTSRARR